MKTFLFIASIVTGLVACIQLQVSAQERIEIPYPSSSVPSQAGPLSSGLLIGVNVTATSQGLKVVSIIPGTPAQGQLCAGDILRYLTADGHPIYSAQRINHIEKAKGAIGLSTRAYLEILRGDKRQFFEVAFVPTADGTTEMDMQAVPVSEAFSAFDGNGNALKTAGNAARAKARQVADPFR